ncbi:MAG: HD domain-containing phosphohydrolase [Gemmatimonadaceae bacterium]
MLPTGPAPRERLLVVDDEDTIRLVLAKYLRTRGFDVTTAESGDAALEALSRSTFDLMLCDVRMPGLSGVELVPEVRRLHPNLGIVMLSAVNDAPTATEAMSHGVLDYLTKPIELQHLHDAVQRALHKRMLVSEQNRFERALREEVAQRTRELEREKAQLHDVTVGVIESLVNAMEAKDLFQRGHSARVSQLAASIAHHLGLAPDVVEDVRIAGRVHDVGNIGIRSDVLGKPAPLDPHEVEHVREHVRISVEILSPLRHIERAVEFVGDHHERWDGAGYPNARAGDRISIGGRILAVADAFDSLISKRAFREPVGTDEALGILERDAGAHFDPGVLAALRSVVKKRKTLVFVDPVHE